MRQGPWQDSESTVLDLDHLIGGHIDLELIAFPRLGHNLHLTELLPVLGFGSDVFTIHIVPKSSALTAPARLTGSPAGAIGFGSAASGRLSSKPTYPPSQMHVTAPPGSADC